MDVISGGQNLAGHFVQSSIQSEIVLKYSATRQIMLCSKSGTFPLLVHFIDQLKYMCGNGTVHVLNDSTLVNSRFQRKIKSRRFLEMVTRWLVLLDGACNCFIHDSLFLSRLNKCSIQKFYSSSPRERTDDDSEDDDCEGGRNIEREKGEKRKEKSPKSIRDLCQNRLYSLTMKKEK